MCAPNKRKRLPKVTATPDRKVLIDKCGNYASDSISELLKKHGPYPIMLPENEVLSLSLVSDRPIETKVSFKEGAGKRKSKVKTSEEISEICQRRTKHFFEEGPLLSCNQKDCYCQGLVNDKDAQDRLRTNYVELMTRSESNDIGNLLLLTYIIVNGLNNLRK